MTKGELIQEVAHHYPRFSPQDAEGMVNAVFARVAEALARGERIELRGFGSFGLKERPARQGRNPRTGAVVAVAARTVPFFKAAAALRARVDDKREQARTSREHGTGEPAGEQQEGS